MTRSISTIALEIQKEWPKVSIHAVPYLNAMLAIHTLKDKYGVDDARSIVVYFLSNAGSFRGEAAKRLKDELKALLKEHKQ